jgi:hypothetical protein
MKRIVLSLITGMLIVTASTSAFAHPLADKAKAIEEQARLLQQKMAAPAGAQLTWGQQMAADDMNRLVNAASAAYQALAPEDAEIENAKAQVTELQVAGNRVRMTMAVANLDEEGRKVGESLLGQIKELEQNAVAERDDRYARRTVYSRPSVGIGLGFGNYWGGGWGSPWGFNSGWGYPGYYGIGRGFGYPIGISRYGYGVRSGFGVGIGGGRRGFRCR